MAKQVTKKTPPDEGAGSLQFELFSQFVENDPSGVSNTIEVWESIPKYFFTPKQTKALSQRRNGEGAAEPYKWAYRYRDTDYEVKIKPAQIEQKDGSYQYFFPSVTEELVEEALKKIMVDQRYGLHDAANIETWVKFSLSMIERELKARGRSRNRNEIKHAIEVMSDCTLTLYKEGKEVWKGNILLELITVGRDEYEADSSQLHLARLPAFISHAINQLEYKQFNYSRLMSCDTPLSRWIYKQLVNRFKQASLMNSYHFMFNDLSRDSGLLQQGTAGDNRKKAISALKHLQNKSVLLSYQATPIKEGTKIINVKYTVSPSPDFIAEQKKMNKRATQNLTRASKAGIAHPKQTTLLIEGS